MTEFQESRVAVKALFEKINTIKECIAAGDDDDVPRYLYDLFSETVTELFEAFLAYDEIALNFQLTILGMSNKARKPRSRAAVAADAAKK